MSFIEKFRKNMSYGEPFYKVLPMSSDRSNCIFKNDCDFIIDPFVKNLGSKIVDDIHEDNIEKTL